MRLNVKPYNCAGGQDFVIECDQSANVLDIKKRISEKVTDMPPETQKLVFRGRILSNSDTTTSAAIGDNATLFLVKVRPTRAPTPAPAPVSAPSPSPAPAPAPAQARSPASPFGFGMPSLADMQRQMMQNPGMMQNMARHMETMMQNPDFMQNIGNVLRSNPETQRLMEQHPELNHFLNDPETLRQAVQAMSNPAMMQEMMRNNDRTMSNMENHPEGYNMLRRMFASNPEGTSGGFGNPFASTSTTTTTTSTQESLATESPNSQALPNPWARRAPAPSPAPSGTGTPAPTSAFGGFAGFGDMMRGMTGSGGIPAIPPERMLQMMENPNMERLVTQLFSNPDMIRQMQAQNPVLRQMVEANPMLRSMLNNPEIMRQFADPQSLRAALRLRAAMTGSRGGGAAGGMPDLSSVASLFGTAAPTPAPAPAPVFSLSALDSAFDTVDSGRASATSSTVDSDELARICRELGSATSQAESVAPVPSLTASSSSAPAPSPPAPSPLTPAATTTTATVAPAAATQYATELEQLHALGFVDDEENMRALRVTNGDVNEAVGILLGGI